MFSPRSARRLLRLPDEPQWATDLVAGTWIVAAFFAMPWEDVAGVVVLIGLPCCYAAALVWHFRSYRDWLCSLVLWAGSAALAGLFVAFLLTLSRPETAGTVAAMALITLPSTYFGARLSDVRERSTGTRGRLLAKLWRDVDIVASSRVGGEVVRFDVRGLRRKVTRAETARARQVDPKLFEPTLRFRQAVFTVLTWALPIGVLSAAFGATEMVRNAQSDLVGQLLGLCAFVLLLGVGWVVIAWFGARQAGQITSVADHLRYAAFAADNGFDYHPRGCRTLGDELRMVRVMRRFGGRPMLMANTERTGDGIDGQTHFGGICERQVSTELPHILLRRTRRGLPAFSSYRAPARSQRLSLEGDFDRYFDLYCPAGYERDALYLLTPDVMAWLADDVHGFDVELIGNRVVLRSTHDLVTRDPAVWARLAGALHALEGRVSRWERWRDDRHWATERTRQEQGRPSTSRVAMSGRRLRAAIGPGTVITIVLAGLYAAVTVFSNAL